MPFSDRTLTVTATPYDKVHFRICTLCHLLVAWTPGEEGEAVLASHDQVSHSVQA